MTARAPMPAPDRRGLLKLTGAFACGTLTGAATSAVVASCTPTPAPAATPHPDAELLALEARQRELSAAYQAAETAESAAWSDWFDNLPRVPAELMVQDTDQAFFCCTSRCVGGVWTPEMCRALRPELAKKRADLRRHPEWERVRANLARGEEILAARRRHDRARNAPPHVAREQRFKELQGLAMTASDQLEEVEAAIRSIAATTPAGLAVKARLLLRYFSPDREGETWADVATRGFLQQVVTAAEREG